MNTLELLLLSLPAALVAFKLGVLVLAALWAMNSLFRYSGLLPARRVPVPVAVRLRQPRRHR